MSDRVFFSLCALLALCLIALSLVWPQGLGARSPGPFGRPVADPVATPAAAAAPAAAAPSPAELRGAQAPAP